MPRNVLDLTGIIGPRVSIGASHPVLDWDERLRTMARERPEDFEKLKVLIQQAEADWLRPEANNDA